MKKIVILKNKKYCTGCGACYAACPFFAIDMIVDKEGFKYPKISEERCKKCGKCLSICPVRKYGKL